MKYHCSECRGKGTSHKKEFVEEKFAERLSELEYQSFLKEALVVAIEENWELDKTSNGKLTKKLNKKLMELDAQDDEIARKNIMGVFTNEHTKNYWLKIALREHK